MFILKGKYFVFSAFREFGFKMTKGVRDIMVVLVTCKYEEDPIKNEDARVLTRFSPL